jgi:hypothetical protein
MIVGVIPCKMVIHLLKNDIGIGMVPVVNGVLHDEHLFNGFGKTEFVIEFFV